MNSRPTASHRRLSAMVLATGLTFVLGVTGVDTADATAASSAVPSESRRVSFAGTTFATEVNESVDVVGTLTVVTRLTGSDQTGWTLDWYTNVSNTTGTGVTTGAAYQGSGADSGSVFHPPGPPSRTAFLDATFMLFPPGPPSHPPAPIRLAVNVVFDETGHVFNVDVTFDDGSIGSVD